MSYNKNTVSESEINSIIEVLKELDVEYTLETIGKVKGYGLNDEYNNKEEHEIRKLTYKDFIVLEKMIRTTDCDLNDVIISNKFKKEEAPKEWEIEETFEND